MFIDSDTNKFERYTHDEDIFHPDSVFMQDLKKYLETPKKSIVNFSKAKTVNDILKRTQRLFKGCDISTKINYNHGIYAITIVFDKLCFSSPMEIFELNKILSSANVFDMISNQDQKFEIELTFYDFLKFIE